jgi:inosine/xanthosine triphosphate pyrophosphatase family protein
MTFAEMEAAEKNKLSHRARALEKLCTFLLHKGETDNK